MNCQRCTSDRVASISAKCSDLCFYSYKGKESDGYVPGNVGLEGGDYVAFKYCLECGQIQDKFPVADPEI